MNKDSEDSPKKRIENVKCKILLVVLIWAPIAGFFIYISFDRLLYPFEKKPWVSWFDDPYQRVYISWETESSTQGTVYYGTDPENLALSVAETEAKTLHHVNLTGLSANTKYYYKVEINSEIFGTGEFRTAPTTYSEFTWAMISDTQRVLGPGHNLGTAEAFRGKNYTFVANVGDILDDGDDQLDYNYYFSVSSIYMNTIPFVPVIGNHDY